ncbi:HypC/HybG/HupF family hydrogenase formation chaperone [Thioalkalivibrio paradoxus]|uniref:Hydrogenase n=1 Tax=Thioalkalivibrio paradoxus ARh 1 TaxID=713585 RepID=W0DLZ0_9GAMM|nr:HypC/HybG/HupF family hydrogenase formation chaperone [Thioalkalivibrio paradoxus]AHE98008.1 hydrogenase [Thioalkalivibrio paradoxus ARh 1]
MCLGVPMQVVESGEFTALCERRGEQRRLNMMLVGAQPVGTWVLALKDHAREVLDPGQAEQIDRAVCALEAALRGEGGSEDYFEDLVLPSQVGPPK